MNSPKDEWLHAWHVNPSANKDYDLLDGLRGIAILLVLGAHHIYFNPDSGPIVCFIGGAFHAGGFGVRVFFALSGFLISWPFWKRKARGLAQLVPPGYGWRRFWKIYPPLALSIVLFTPVYILHLHDFSFAAVAAQWLFGLPLFIPVDGRFNPVIWSLIVEMHFYIVLPLLFLCLKKTSAKLCLWIIFLLLLVIPVGWRWLEAANGIYFTLHPEINVHFPSMLDSFAFGVLLAGFDNTGVIRKAWAKFGDIGFILLFLSLLTMSWLELHHLNETNWAAIPTWGVKISSAFLLCYIADPQHPRARLLSQPWLRWCGIISYEWYLIHQPLLLWFRDWMGPTHGSLLKYGLVIIIPFVTSTILAAVVYRCFSLPILKYGRDKHTPEKAGSKLVMLEKPQKT